MSFHRLGYILEKIVNTIFVKHQKHSEIRNKLLDTTDIISIIKNKEKQTNKKQPPKDRTIEKSILH